MKMLVTGGAGYIGSHAVVELLAAGYDVHVVDSLQGSEPWIIDRISQIAGKPVSFTQLDLLDGLALEACFRKERPDGVVHFAALKSITESVGEPLRYYQNNISGLLNLLDCMSRHECNQLVFSSSANVYGQPDSCPVKEDAPTRPLSPYGRTKLFGELIIQDHVAAQGGRMAAAVLRYFNPVGAHESGLIGELPRGQPNNLAPYVAQAAAGLRAAVQVFGSDYPTPDGTGLRDYIHVSDLAEAHVAALASLQATGASFTVNVGTGRAYSVLELIEAFSVASGRDIPHERVGRRAGDIAECWADPGKANRTLGWRSSRGLKEICEDAWRWQNTLKRL